MKDWIKWQSGSFYFEKETDIHVWLIPIRQSTRFLEFLSEMERRRANRYRVESAREQFVVSRASLRLLLEAYCHIPYQQIEFELNDFGKPYLKNGQLLFNVSHSYQWALIALSQTLEIGVDIEKVRPKLNLRQLATRFFSTTEVEELNQLPPKDLSTGFFNAWTRKEAYIKARGKGLAIPLSQFSVSLSPGQKAQLKETTHDPQAVQQWALTDLPAPKGYRAALAVKAQHFNVLRWLGEDLFKLHSKSF